MLLGAIIGIFLVSLLLAFLSLRHEERKTKQEEHAQKELAKSKVLFYQSSVSEESSRAFAESDK